MFIQCVFPLLTLFVGLAHSFSWDIVVGKINVLEFYNDGTLTHSVKPANDLMIEWLSYDPTHKRVLFFGKIRSTDAVFSFDLSTMKTQTLMKNKHNQDISTIAYDPETGLFFGIINKIIYSFLIKPGNDNDVDNVDDVIVINLQKDDSEPRDIVVESSCGGYLYWTTFSNTNMIERVRFNGSERQVILDSTDKIRVALAIDPHTKKMYWIECQVYISFSILTADLNGKNIRALYSEEASKMPDRLTVSKDFIYWGNKMQRYFWQLPSNPPRDTIVEPKRFSMDIRNFRFGLHGIATKYEIEEQAQGIPICKALNSLATTDSDSRSVSTDVSLLCVHGTKLSGESRCECSHGYSGERCDVSACQNYCIQGECSISTDGQPKCRCNAGYSGSKCEVKACQGHCLNNGICSLDEDNEPVCQCTSHYEGDKCNVPIFLNQCKSSDLNTDVKPVTLGKGVKSTSPSQLPRMTVAWKNGASSK